VTSPNVLPVPNASFLVQTVAQSSDEVEARDSTPTWFICKELMGKKPSVHDALVSRGDPNFSRVVEPCPRAGTFSRRGPGKFLPASVSQT